MGAQKAQKRRLAMKMSIIRVIFTLLLLISYHSSAPLIANADENDCILKASVDVIVEVWNADDEGNKGQRIWKGLIKQGEQKHIKSQHGQIRYAPGRSSRRQMPAHR